MITPTQAHVNDTTPNNLVEGISNLSNLMMIIGGLLIWLILLNISFSLWTLSKRYGKRQNFTSQMELQHQPTFQENGYERNRFDGSTVAFHKLAD